MNEKFKAAIALTIGIFLAIIISESTLQTLDFPSRPVSGWLNCKSKNPGECNSMGFRGREIAYADDDFVVVLLGDSEVYARSFPFEEMPERRLEHFLRIYRKNVKVFTIADMGYGQDQQYLALEKYFERYRADLVLLMFTARNDIDNNIFPVAGRNNTIKPTFWLEKDELKRPSEQWLKPVSSRLKLVLIWQYYFGKPAGELRMETWKNNILPKPYQPLTQYQGEVDYSWQEGWNSSPEHAFLNLDYEMGAHSSMKFTPRSEMRTYGIKLTRKLLSEIRKLVEENKGHFIFFKEERLWELQDTDREKVYFLNGKFYKTSMKQYKDNLMEIFYGFEHYRIPVDFDFTKGSKAGAHLDQRAIDKLMKELSNIIGRKGYFKGK